MPIVGLPTTDLAGVGVGVGINAGVRVGAIVGIIVGVEVGGTAGGSWRSSDCRADRSVSCARRIAGCTDNGNCGAT